MVDAPTQSRLSMVDIYPCGGEFMSSELHFTYNYKRIMIRFPCQTPHHTVRRPWQTPTMDTGPCGGVFTMDTSLYCFKNSIFGLSAITSSSPEEMMYRQKIGVGGSSGAIHSSGRKLGKGQKEDIQMQYKNTYFGH